jgi:N-acetylglucosaminyldiphosphoundecaprenol N-acetyl-beta-D-mannosaminyltransferase
LQTVVGTDHVPTPLDIMGIPVVPFESYDQALEYVERIVKSNSKSFWVAINPIKVYHAWHDSELRNLLLGADVGICDGVGVSIASRILHGRDIKRCTGCDLFFRLLSLASLKGWGVYLLGASTESNAAARLELQRSYPDLKIVGWQDGYFEDSRAVIRQINRSKAKLLFVAMGSPKQEQWISRHRRAIKANFCMGVGGSFDIAAGRLARAPKICRVAGAEFLYRLIREPRKRWRIQKVLIPYFVRVVEKKLVDLFISEEGRIDQARP